MHFFQNARFQRHVLLTLLGHVAQKTLSTMSMHFINVGPSMQIARVFFELKWDFLTTSTRVMEIEYDLKWPKMTH